MKYFTFLFLAGICFINAQNFWNKTNPPEENHILNSQKGIPLNQVYQLDFDGISERLWNLNENESIELSFPNLNGETFSYTIREFSNFEPDLQAQFPHIKSFVGKSQDDPTAYLRMSIGEDGISVMILRPNNQYQFIDKLTEDQIYGSYQKVSLDKNSPKFECFTDNAVDPNPEPSNNAYSNQGVFKTFRLVVSTDGEYTLYHGGAVADAMSAINATLTHVNAVYEVDLAVHLNLISQTLSVIYIDANTDPYSGNASSQLQSTLNSVVGSANYDIGHLFSANGAGGYAGCIGCICDDVNKGSGYSASYQPGGVYFDIDYVSHEMGHQLGARHSFSWNPDENSAYNVEPGSGSTIMGYAGITGSTDVQSHSDPYFVYKSAKQIQDNLSSKPCAENLSTANATPQVVTAPQLYIPKGTAFKLTGSATDDQQDDLTYCWEQNDDANSSALGSNSFPYPTKISGPNFRSFNPKDVPVRYFPQFSSVLNGNLCPTWECISDVGRTLNFALTVRDNQQFGQTNTSFSSVQVNGNIGPFKVLSPNTSTTVPLNQDLEVTWDVAGSNQSPVNCQTVNILLSVDGGNTFTTLVEGTPNDGSQMVSLAGYAATIDAIIMVEAADNVFYALQNFYIGYSIEETCNEYTYGGAPLSIADNAQYLSTQAPITVSAPNPSNSVISSVTAYVDISHTYLGDLDIKLQSPQNSEIYLWSSNCDNNQNIQITFDDAAGNVICGTPTSGTYRPLEPLSNFNGQIQTGTWYVKIGDFEAQDTGTFNTATLNICSLTVSPLGVDDIDQSQLDFAIYPNPANQIVKIQSDFEFSKYSIYNNEGRLIAMGDLSNDEIDVSNIPVGAYLLQLNGDNNEYNVKSFLISR